MAVAKKKDKNKNVLECNIEPKLFEAWKKLRRARDSEKIAERFGWSRPPIDNALNYGNVRTDQIVGQINEYFKDRLEKEKNQATELLELQEKTQGGKK